MALAALRPAGLETPERGARVLRVALDDGAETTAYVAAHATARTTARVVVLRRPEPLLAWCRRAAVPDAIVGGFYVRPSRMPLGEVRTAGVARAHVPFDAPWHDHRSCVHVAGGRVALAPRGDLPATPRGDLLQAGPLLVRDGVSVIHDGVDPEGFSQGQGQFDSDITTGRYPRAALGVAESALMAVACDGRADGEAGLSLAELAALLEWLGAEGAINLDGGGSASLVCGGRLANRPREQHGTELPGGRTISTAVVFLPRR